ncbi:MAG: penicillin-binding protein 2 [Conexibacteraceae bacterium]|nr:penicillin-binding protein 2 [Conexibacteraceae bacterium]
MNNSIVRLFAVVIVLFTVLIVWTSRWTVFSATALNNNRLNNLQYYASLKVQRGQIQADNGDVLARSVKATGGTWSRTYPTGPLFSQPVGYFFPSTVGAAGLESSRNDELRGLQNAFTSVFGSFNGTPTVGDDVQTTLDPPAQTLARSLLDSTIASTGATSGSVVALTPSTGAVKVLYSSPGFDNNHPSACKAPGCSQFIGALQGGYPPGSTFKTVTATAALDSGKYAPDSIINGRSPITVSGTPLENDLGSSYGDVTLTFALTNSINTVFAQVGQDVGGAVMQTYMRRFGFYSVPPLDFPARQMSPSGYWSQGRLVPLSNADVDLGRASIGQAGMLVTPMQMAMVASAIANGGKLMQPRLTTRVVNNDGQVVERIGPQEYDQVMKPSTSAELTTMMRSVVEEGTGTAANLQGVSVAGKTGTASTGGTKGGQPLDDAWFIGFGPVPNPTVAVAVELSDIPNGYGGVYAAPIAAQVIKTLVAEHQ